MRVLVACEFSGIVRDAFIAKGHDAWSCDLLPSDKPGHHIQDDVLNHMGDGWDLMIAHPPCKYLCNGGNNWLNRRPDLAWRDNREKGAEFFMRFINAPIPRICVENPTGCMSSKYRKPNQIIHPYEFGHIERKDTCLWLKRLPPLMTTLTAPASMHRKIDFWSDKRNPNGKSLKSITYTGIAAAMAAQWGSLLLLLCASASGQVQMQSNSVYAAVDGSVMITQDGTNFVTVPCNGVIFNFVEQTNDVPPPPPPTVARANLMSIRSRLTNAVTNKAVMGNPITRRVARSYSDSDTTDTWQIQCPICRSNFNAVVKLGSPTIQLLK